MFGINPMELMIILLVALIVVGPKRLPEIGRTIGRAFSELRRVQDEVRDTIRFDLEDDEPEPPTRPARRPRSPDSPRTPSAAELASAAEDESAEDSATDPRTAEDPGGGPRDAEDLGAEPRAEDDSDPDPPVEGPTVTDAPARPEPSLAPATPPGTDSPNGSPKRPARDEAG